jgi:predicted nucleotidyltransferase
MQAKQHILTVLKNLKPFLLEEYKVTKIGLFGSYVANRNHTNSDIDVLVDFYEVPGLLKYAELEEYLNNTLQSKIDLVYLDALKPTIGKQILKQVEFV